MNKAYGLIATLLGAGVLSACAAPPAPAPPPPSPPDYSRQQRVYQQAREIAAHFEKLGRLREAQHWLEVAAASSSGSPPVSEDIARVQNLLRAQVADLLRVADQAYSDKDWARATECYERALSLDPSSDHARNALRGLDAKSVMSAIAHGGGGGPAAPTVARPAD